MAGPVRTVRPLPLLARGRRGHQRGQLGRGVPVRGGAQDAQAGRAPVTPPTPVTDDGEDRLLALLCQHPGYAARHGLGLHRQTGVALVDPYRGRRLHRARTATSEPVHSYGHMPFSHVPVTVAG
ncbi:hypothetical protein GCM10017771_83430 [Streptomyces capitiformicae]|uniref:Uncharacterized protein n=1 Tax=Streptomyces capitiformicae TaxID=2014920 RepID=A0A918ZMJ4_9ACTN|nr:hypothetical protein GCM10017771_83430 [Streptomyces capitiformicae]